LVRKVGMNSDMLIPRSDYILMTLRPPLFCISWIRNSSNLLVRF